MYYLLKYADNWADEMDIDGHIVLDEVQYRMFNDVLIRFSERENFEITFWIGTNEEVSYDTHRLQRFFTVTEINNEDYEVLRKLKLVSRGYAESFVKWIIDYSYSFDDDTEWDDDTE